MRIFPPGRVFLLRLLSAILWACFPTLLLYASLYPMPLYSRIRLGASATALVLFAFIAFQMSKRLSRLPWNTRFILIITSAVLACYGSAALSFFPEETYLFGPQHRLTIAVVNLESGQALEVRSLQTSLGDITYSSFRDLTGWKRQGSVLIPASASPPPLTWLGWAGDSAALHFSGSTGVKINIAWDSRSTTIDLGQTGGKVIAVQQRFSTPLWSEALLALILWGTIDYGVAAALVSQQSTRTVLGLDAGLLAALGFLSVVWACFLAILLWKAPVADWELPMLCGLACMCILPAYLLTRISTGWLEQASKNRLTAWLKQHSRLLVWVLLGLFVSLLFGASLQTNWSSIDDREIVQFLGSDGRMSLGQVLPTLITRTEVSRFGDYTRFRPSYYFLRLLESAIWGAHPLYWHAFRVLILILAVGLFAMLMSRALGWLDSGLLCAYALTFPYLVDVIGKLGASETYAVLGLPLFIWGMVNALQEEPAGRQRKILMGAAILVGSMICIGSKENFLLLILPLFYLVYRAVQTRNLTLLVSALSGVLFAAWVGTSLVLGIGRQGTDIYANSISPAARAARIAEALQTPQNQVAFMTLAGIIALLGITSLVFRLAKDRWRPVVIAEFWLVALGVVYISQLIFYNGLWPTGIRYDFPGLLYIPATTLILAWLSQRLLPGNLTRVCRTCMTMALLLAIIWKGYFPITEGIHQNIIEANEFSRTLDKAVSLLRGHPDYALVIESGRAIDYEPVFSYETFLRTYGVKNPLFLRTHGYSVETANSDLQTILAAQLLRVSARGNGDFLPLDRLGDFGNRCYSLSLSGSFTDHCIPIQ